MGGGGLKLFKLSAIFQHVSSFVFVSVNTTLLFSFAGGKMKCHHLNIKLRYGLRHFGQLFLIIVMCKRVTRMGTGVVNL